MKVRSLLAALAATCMLAGVANAQVTYVDATDTASGNTAIAGSAGGGVFTGLAAQGPASDGAWDKRAFGNGPSIFQNAANGAVDDAVRLVTNISVPDSTYNVFAYFWVDSGPGWRIRAGLSDIMGDLPLYLRSTAGTTQFYNGSDATILSDTLSPNPFNSAVMIAEGNRRLIQVPLGQVTGSSISVYIDDEGAAQADAGARTWYDGIGYSRVPEPASAGLMVVGLLGLATRLRRSGK